MRWDGSIPNICDRMENEMILIFFGLVGMIVFVLRD